MKTAEDLRKEVKLKLDLKLEEDKLTKDKLEEYRKSGKYKEYQLQAKKVKKELLDKDVSRVLEKIESKINIILESKDSKKDTNEEITPRFFKSSLIDIKNELTKLGYDVSEKYYDASIYGDFPYNSYVYLSIDLKMFLQQ